MVDYSAKIKELQDEIRNTQYNKATQHHIGRVKAKIAKLRREQEERSSGGGGGGQGYQVRRTGDGTVILVGFPSAGKSTLLNKLTNANSETGSYAFTTLTVVPGLLEHKGAQIQILDVPGIVSGAAAGRGRGREVLATVRSADLVLILLDATRSNELNAIRSELYDAGIRIDKQKPVVKLTKKARDGLDIGRTIRTPHLNDRTIKEILGTYRIFNADIVIRSRIDADEFIDAVEGNRKYLPSLLVLNKMDLLTPEKRKELEKTLHPDLFIAAKSGTGIDELKDLIFDKLGLMRIWMKEPGKEADLEEPLIVRSDSTIQDVARKIHRDFANKFKFARVTGPSAKFARQKKGLNHTLQDSDIVELHMK